jgi:hypothetical protein
LAGPKLKVSVETCGRKVLKVSGSTSWLPTRAGKDVPEPEQPKPAEVEASVQALKSRSRSRIWLFWR